MAVPWLAKQARRCTHLHLVLLEPLGGGGAQLGRLALEQAAGGGHQRHLLASICLNNFSGQLDAHKPSTDDYDALGCLNKR